MVRKGINALITIFGIICLNYALLRLMPGDPALSLTPRDPKYQGLAEYNRQLFGFDKPPWEQFVIYLQRTVTLDWGISYRLGLPVFDVLMRDFVTTAKAKGLSDSQVLRRHILPSGLPPMVALIALDIAFVIGGAYQVEVVFNYYGIGWETIQAIDNLDFPLLQFIVVVGGVAIVLANLVSDFILLLLDPRIKVS